ncbi:MAG: nicotinamide mononucleotide transporter [Clostridia bacterium]|nr:nicotinamide mononucleotide transporter [Clostridia bacterium]
MSTQSSSKQSETQIFRYVLLSFAFVAYVICGIVFQVPFLTILPLFVSLFVVMLQARVNRFGYLLGGINSVLYAIVYISTGIYASAASALLFSLPIQLMTFLRWQKHSYEKSTVLRKMSNKGRILTLALFLVSWGAILGALILLGSDFAILDTSVSLLGILVSLLTMLAYIEYAPLWLLSNILSLMLTIQVTLTDISFLPHAVAGVYNLICTATALFNVFRLYKKQTTTVNEPHPDII